MKYRSITSPTLFFTKIVLASLGTLYFHMNFEISLSILHLVRLISIILEEMKTHIYTEICMLMFISTLVTSSPKPDKPKCPSRGE